VVNFSNNPVEVIEAEYPIAIERYGFLPDTGGPGRFRGGLALVREYRFLEAEGVLQLRTDRRRFLPYGLAGGRPGTPAANLLNPAGEARELPGKCTITVRRGDVFRHVLAGAGGWGDPLERDPERVGQDVLEEKIGAAYARREYGVVVDETTGEVYQPETAALRAARRAGHSG
jgi:N-methylhydantoinase B